MTTDALFDDGDLRADLPEPLSRDRKATARVGVAIRHGAHPLAFHDPTIRMHPDADVDADRADGPDLPFRCGTCVHRVMVSWHSQSYPKCEVDWPHRGSHGRSTDVRAWWPACRDYEPTKEPE